MDASEFAALALGLHSISFLANCLDAGLNQSSLKLAIERDSWSFVAANIALKAVLFAVAMIGLILSSVLFPGQTQFVIIASAASAAFWATTRLAALNLVLTCTRVVFGGVAILTREWTFVALAVYVAAPLPIHFATAAGVLRKAMRSVRLRDALSLGAISPFMFASSLLYGALPLMTQAMLNKQADASSAAAFGIALIFLGPLSLVVATVRLYILPQALMNRGGRIDLYGLGSNSSHLLALAVTLSFAVGIGCISLLVHTIYANRLPESTSFVLIYGFCNATASVLGLYNISVLRGSLIRLDLFVNVLRAGSTWALTWAGGLNAIEIVAWSGAILLAGEVILLGVLTFAKRAEHD
jgi:hypothetical protein